MHFAATPAPQPQQPAGDAVQQEQREQYRRRIGRHENEHHHDADHEDERHALLQVDVLEAVERHVRHHRDAGVNGEDERQPGEVLAGHRDPLRRAQVGDDPDEPGDQRGGRRAGQALEETLVDDADVRVEARQTQRGAGHVDEGGEPAPLAQPAQRPLVDDERRRRAERHHVGQAVVLLAEGALRVGHPRHAPVQAVEHHRDEDRDRRRLEAHVHRLHDRVEAAEQRRSGEGVGQQVDAPRAARRQALAAALVRHFRPAAVRPAARRSRAPSRRRRRTVARRAAGRRPRASRSG